MACKKQGVPFAGTEEQRDELLKVISELKDEKGALMPIMQKAQEIYGLSLIHILNIEQSSCILLPAVPGT